MNDALHTTVLDHAGLVRLFRHLVGRKLLAVVDAVDCVELVFEHAGEDDRNLVTIYTGGRPRGFVAFGFVSQDLVDAGYGQP